MKQTILAIIYVGIGGMAGSIVRYLFALIAQRYEIMFPAGTVAANVLGCFIIGIIMQLAAETTSVSPEMRLLLATGFCGGFTTMSSMVYETMQYVKSDEYLHAFAYSGGTLLFSFAAFLAGSIISRLLIKAAF